MGTKNARRRACVCGQLQKATRGITQFYDRTLRPAGLRISQYAMLRNIGRAGAPSVGELGGILRMDQSTAVRNLAVLRKKGWVDIAPDKDARRKLVSLTRRGERKLDEALPHWERAQDEIAAGMEPGDLDALARILARIGEAASGDC